MGGTLAFGSPVRRGPRRRLVLGLGLGLLALPALAPAQSYEDFMTVRGRPWPWTKVWEVEAGLIGDLASDDDPSIGNENEFSGDGHIWYHNARFGDRQATLDFLASREGAYLGVLEGDLIGGGGQSRLELFGRYFPFYREGFYRGDEFIPTGQYEGFDYGAQLSFASEVAEDLRLEFGTFVHRLEFERDDQTDPSYRIPDDYLAYGARVTIEHNTLALDRETGLPREGYIATVIGEREQNTSSRRFGVIGVFESDLPSGLWRARGHLEWYFPQSASWTWSLRTDASISDDNDRVQNYDAYHPLGHTWVQPSLHLRWDLSESWSLTPFITGQWLRILGERGASTDDKLFWGGGVEGRFALGQTFAIVGDYSWLSNESRAPVSIEKDTFGEHRFFVGMQARFGAQRSF